jgi:hypothetical protein
VVKEMKRIIESSEIVKCVLMGCALFRARALTRVQGGRHELAEEEHRRQAGARDSGWERPYLLRGVSGFACLVYPRGTDHVPRRRRLGRSSTSRTAKTLRVSVSSTTSSRIFEYVPLALLLRIPSDLLLSPVPYLLAHLAALQDPAYIERCMTTTCVFAKRTIAAKLLAISLLLTVVMCSDGWFSKH